MNLRNRVKHLFRMCGHAMNITVHERLNRIEEQVQAATPIHTRMVETRTVETRTVDAQTIDTQAALLQAAIHTTETLNAVGETQTALLHAAIRTAETLNAVRETQTTLFQAVAHGNETLNAVWNTQTTLLGAATHGKETLNAVGETQTTLLQAAIHSAETLNGLSSYSVVETEDYHFCNPETGLMEFLYSYLPFRNAIDIGANAGDVSERLLHTGYEVYAFEPYPPVYAKLVERLGRKKGFHAFPFALGAENGEAPLHLVEDRSGGKKYGDPTVYSSLSTHPMPDDLVFKEAVAVPIKTLKTLHASGDVPANVGLVKIDTEGFDLEVIRGMGEHRYPVVLAEFWDKDLVFARSAVYTLEDLAHQMRERGYLWHLVVYRVWGLPQIGYYANYSRSVANSWGNAAFFNDYSLFAQAQMWCSATLPRTYFKHSLPQNTDRAQ